MVGALLYLRFASLRNLAVVRVRRLRQPKYLLGAIAGGGYFYLFFLRRLGTAAPGGLASGGEFAAIFGAGIAFLFFIGRLALAWMAPAESPGLRFSEAEIAFLFPAPFSRRTLLHYRLLSAQLAILGSALIVTLLTRRFQAGGGATLIRAVGWWLVFSTLDLHLTATTLTLARLRERGAPLLRWRAAVIGAILLYAAIVAACGYRTAAGLPAPILAQPEALLGYFRAIFSSGPLFWLLLPFRIVVGPFVANGAREFLIALGPALALVALHYAWVMRLDAPFEEGSIALAQRRSAARERRQGAGPVRPPRAAREPFRLGAGGRPETAFLWKNLLSMRSSLASGRAALAALVVVGFLGLAFHSVLAHGPRAGGAALPPLIVAGAGMAAFYILLLGPQFARQDLRSDLPNADLLKTYPLEGWQLALGELLAPTAILTLLLWICLFVALAAFNPAGGTAWLTPGLRTVTGACLAALAPVLSLLQLLVPNALMLLFPAWYQASRTRGGGVEVMGQRLIFVFGQLAVAIAALAPAAGAAGLIIFAAQWILGPIAAVLLATVGVLPILIGEAAVGLWFLGYRFGRFDLSSELKP